MFRAISAAACSRCLLLHGQASTRLSILGNSSRPFFGTLNDFWNRPAQKHSSYEVVKLGNVSPTRSVPSHVKKPDYAVTGRIPRPRRSVEIKLDWQIEGMRQACLLARRIMTIVATHVKPGVTTDELDVIAHEAITAHGAYPSPLLYRGYPKAICTSVNNVACHGIPDDRPLQDGDIVSIDTTVYHNNFHGDCAHTFMVGKVDPTGERLVAAAKKCRDEAVGVCRPEQPFSSIGKTISSVARAAGFRVMPAFCGHGIGSYFHGPPDVYHFENNGKGKMREGMTFTIEPVITEGTDEVVVLEDGWSAVSLDNSRSAQFEHTVLITPNGVEVLTE